MEEIVRDRPFTEADLRQMVLRLAHEIRNPLATIQSAVQLLEHLQRPEPELLEYYESVYGEIGRIDRVVRDMQQFVRLDVHTATAIGVADAVARSIETLVSTSHLDGVATLVHEGPEAIVLMDPHQLERAVVELLDNALRHSPAGEPVQISWRLLSGGYVAIDFDDQGPGIPSEHQDHILRPFFSTSTQGTGLGLNIAARVAELAGGRLEWRDRTPRGARFTLILPVLPNG